MVSPSANELDTVSERDRSPTFKTQKHKNDSINCVYDVTSSIRGCLITITTFITSLSRKGPVSFFKHRSERRLVSRDLYNISRSFFTNSERGEPTNRSRTRVCRQSPRRRGHVVRRCVVAAEHGTRYTVLS